MRAGKPETRNQRKMDVDYQEDYIRNSRGIQLFTCRWLPFSSPPKALLFLCHGYGMECSSFMRGCGTRLATAGYAVYGIDYEGHGRSMGARCYIKKFEDIVTDCDRFFKSICEMEENRDKRRFLYGESMGGAVTLLLHQRDPSFWDGAVLVAPMCKISEKVKPHPLVIAVLTRMEELIPKWKVVPTKDIYDTAFKDPIKRQEIRSNKLLYKDKPRLKTALELLRTSIHLEHTLTQVTLPFFVLHGESDTVTDPEVSRALYERASSKDKTMRLYPGMWHALTTGEPDRNIAAVYADIVAWLDDRGGRRGDRRPAAEKVSGGGSGDLQLAPALGKAGALEARSGGGRRRRQRGALCGLKVGPRHLAAM